MESALPKIHAAVDAGMASPRTPVEEPQATPAVSSDGRPLVYITSELHEGIDAGAAALESDPNLFQRDGRLVTSCA